MRAVGTAAGTLAVGLAAGVVMSALAIDLTDAAVAGALLAAGATAPPLQNSSSFHSASLRWVDLTAIRWFCAPAANRTRGQGGIVARMRAVTRVKVSEQAHLQAWLRQHAWVLQLSREWGQCGDVLMHEVCAGAGATFLPAKDAKVAQKTAGKVLSTGLSATEAIARGFGLRSHAERRAQAEAAAVAEQLPDSGEEAAQEADRQLAASIAEAEARHMPDSPVKTPAAGRLELLLCAPWYAQASSVALSDLFGV